MNNKLKLIGALAPIFLYSNNLNHIQELIDKKNYNQAYKESIQLCEIDCSDEKLNMLIGQISEELSLYDDALAAYDRVLIANEYNIDARLAIASIYENNGNYELMKSELSILKEYANLDQKTKKQIQQMLSNIENKSQNKNYNTCINVGIGYDSNPFNINNTNYLENKDDTFNKNSGAVNNTFGINANYNIATNGFLTNFNLDFFNKTYLQNKEYNYPDFSIITLGITPEYYLNKNSNIKLFASYDYILLKRKSFLYSINFGLEYETFLNNNFALIIGYTISNGIFINKDDKNSNFIHHNFYIKNIFAYEDDLYFINIEQNIEQNKYKLFRFRDYVATNISLGTVKKYNKLFLKLQFGIEYEKYRAVNKLYNNRRTDIENFVECNISYQISKHESIEFTNRINNQFSNQKYYEYNSFNTNLSYKYNFN